MAKGIGCSLLSTSQTALRAALSTGGDVSRQALEGFALEKLRAGRITEPELAQALGLGRLQLDGFLKAHAYTRNTRLKTLKAERRALKELGL
jgi:hypothetical protein